MWQDYYLALYGLAILLAPAIHPKMVLNFKWMDKERATPMIAVIGGLTLLYPFLALSIYRTVLQIFLILCTMWGIFAELFLIEWNLPISKKQKYVFNLIFVITNAIQIIALITS